MATVAMCSYRFGSFVSRQKPFLHLCNQLHASAVSRIRSVRSPCVLGSAATQKEKLGSPHWKMFRYISVIMIGVYPAAVLAPSPVIDWAIAAFFPLHSYWGTKEILSDYIPQIFPNKAVTTTVVYIWSGVSALTFLGLAYLNIYDVGVCKAVAMLWKL